MVVNEENTTPPAAKKFDWKIIAGLAVIVLFLAYILFRFFTFVSDRSESAYEKTLVSYYDSLGKKDVKPEIPLVTDDFTSETPELTIAPGKYEIFSYRFENAEPAQDTRKAPASTNTPAPVKAGKIIYSVSTFENNSRVSYLLEAYLVMDNNQPRIQYIKKIYKGRNITK